MPPLTINLGLRTLLLSTSTAFTPKPCSRNFHQASVMMKKYAPSKFLIDDEQKKWRIAVACAVLNSKNELLIGERINIPNAWQAPQGGVDDAWEGNNNQAETVAEAASRELFEEMGLRTGKDVTVISENTSTLSVEPIRYEAKGNDNWLTKNGFSGQELHWVIFRCTNARGDSDPEFMCRLEGQNGEAQEFLKVQWKPIDWVVENIWPAKRGAYEALQGSLNDAVKEWDEQCNMAIDFDGTWSRDASKNEGVVEALIQRGVAADKAASEAERPYVQKWERKEDDVWNVKTYGADNNLRRDVDYQVGKSWREEDSCNIWRCKRWSQSNNKSHCRTRSRFACCINHDNRY
ncbi:unnamed protein product [Cylindrotheca closterium]|uniref:Nudix hydrolase domain-containing protein n=1 Tax=Cylindrotheca closterium TaxID=2856 RepID=A0AAD2FC75_9STRA|nr:unnamed protein product [Cylindrotheca closterium]